MIIVAWSLLIFVGYNVLTVEAVVDDKKEYTWTGPDGHKDRVTLNDFEPEDIADTCDASEDYNRNEKLCDTLYDWEEEIKEKAAKEDAICDNEDADTTDVKICMSEDRKQKNEKEREWYYNENTGSYEYMTDKEIKDHNLESESGIKQGEKWGPETPIEPPSEPYPTTEIEDWSNTVSDDDEAVKKVIKQLQAGDENNVVNSSPSQTLNEPEESEQEEEESEDSEEEESSNEEESSDDGGDSGDSSESEE